MLKNAFSTRFVTKVAMSLQFSLKISKLEQTNNNCFLLVHFQFFLAEEKITYFRVYYSL